MKQPTRLLSVGALVGLATGLAQGGADLVVQNVEYLSIRPLHGALRVEFEYEFGNIGDESIDMRGEDLGSIIDNVGIQTWLADAPDLSGGLRPAGGRLLFDAAVLPPGGVYTGTYSSSTSGLFPPDAFGPYRWLVIDITGTTEAPGATENNRFVVALPGYCGPADLGLPLGSLDLFDVSAFVTAFQAQDWYADLNADAVYDINDNAIFVTSFTRGCP